MKHFRIEYFIGTHAFAYECTTVFEAITALSDLALHDVGFAFYADEYIDLLINLRNGKTLSFNNHKISLHYIDGEV